VVTPIRLQGSEEQEEITEDTDMEDMLRSLAASAMIAPGFRWRRSRWGQLCPVALHGGSYVTGKPEFSVRSAKCSCVYNLFLYIIIKV